MKRTPYSHDGASLTIESSILIPVPEAKDYLIKVENKEKSEISQNRSKQEYLEFYSDLVKRLSDKLPGEYPDPSREITTISQLEWATFIMNGYLEGDPEVHLE